jgi:hypothetical protein
MDLGRLDTLRSVSEATSQRRPEMWFREVPSVSEDVESEASASTHVRMGIGLPLSNIFATYDFLLPLDERSSSSFTDILVGP